MQPPNESSSPLFFQYPHGTFKAKHKGISALYNVLRRLIREHSPLLANVRVEENLRKEVIYLHFKEEPVFKMPHAGYEFKSSHLTIHKHFHDNKLYAHNGLDICHCTQIYTNKNNHTLVVHIFFNSKGAVSTIEVKEFEGARDQANFKVLDVTPGLKKMLFENATIACEMLQTLTNAANEFYMAALDCANALEVKLDNLGNALNENLFKDYVACANAYIAAITQVNEYCLTHYDNRGRAMKERLTKLAPHATPATSSEIEEEDQDAVEEQPERQADQKSTAKKIDLHSEYQAVLHLVSQLKATELKLKGDPNNNGLVIRKYILAKELKDKILLCSIDISKFNEKKIKKLKGVLNTIPNYSDLALIFVTEFWKGNVSFLREVYPFVSTYLNVNFLKEHFFEKIVSYTPSSEEEDVNFRQAFKFLYESCPYFRLIFNNHIQLSFSLEEDVQVTLLLLAFLKNNLYCFKLALAYGMDPNGLGIVTSGLCLPLIFMLACLPHAGEYLKEALATGASYRVKPQKVDVQLSKQQAKRHSLILNPAILAACSRLGGMSDHRSISNALNWCYWIGIYDSIKYFIPQLTIDDLLQIFVKISLESDVERRLTFKTSSGLVLVQESSHQPTLSQSISNFFLCFEIATKDDTKRELLSLLFTRLAQLTVELSDYEIENFYQKIFNAGVLSSRLKQQETRFIFESCLSLLLARPATIMNYQKLMQVFFYLKNFHYVIQIAELTFDGKLKNTPLYTEAMKKLNPTKETTSKSPGGP